VTLFDELLWVHGMVRRDLETVQELAGDVGDGMPPEEVQRILDRLKTSGPLWQLKAGCLQYCRFVHSHHNLEDAALFPMLRRADPDLAPVVERLEADHRRVSDLLDTVEAAAAALDDAEEAEARRRVRHALDELAAHLLEHLELEERSVGPTLARFGRA
jgi:Hemerythrin HHE cation binding domain